MSEENKSQQITQGQPMGVNVDQSQVSGATNLQSQTTGTHTASQNGKLDPVAVHKEDSSSQEISQIKLSNGSVVGEDEAVQLAKEHKVNLVAAKAKSGEEYVRSYPDGNPDNNLQNLPEF